jgi:hypothetical protein
MFFAVTCCMTLHDPGVIVSSPVLVDNVNACGWSYRNAAQVCAILWRKPIYWSALAVLTSLHMHGGSNLVNEPCGEKCLTLDRKHSMSELNEILGDDFAAALSESPVLVCIA